MDYADVSLIVELAAGSPLDRSPKKNWVENAGGLPKYIEDIAVDIEKTGKTVSQAISIAISQVKRWAAGGENVKPDTRAKAAKAVAEWEKLKATNAAKKVAATIPATDEHVSYEVLSLAAESYNISKVTQAWDAEERTRRRAADQARRTLRQTNPEIDIDYDEDRYRRVRETWSDFLVVSSGYDATQRYWKVPYSVEIGGAVTFAPEQEVQVEYTATTSEIAGVSMSRQLTGTERLALSMATADHVTLGVAADHPEIVELARRVKTAAGAKLFGQPVGSVITADKLAAVRKTVGAAKVRQVSSLGSRAPEKPKAPSAPGKGTTKTKASWKAKSGPAEVRREFGKGNQFNDETDWYDRGPGRDRFGKKTGAARRGETQASKQYDANRAKSDVQEQKQKGINKDFPKIAAKRDAAVKEQKEYSKTDTKAFEKFKNEAIDFLVSIDSRSGNGMTYDERRAKEKELEAKATTPELEKALQEARTEVTRRAFGANARKSTTERRTKTATGKVPLSAEQERIESMVALSQALRG